MIVHFYRLKRHNYSDAWRRQSRYKAVCTNTYMEETDDVKFASVAHNVTCKTCLEMVYPIEEQKFLRLKHHYERVCKNDSQGS